MERRGEERRGEGENEGRPSEEEKDNNGNKLQATHQRRVRQRELRQSANVRHEEGREAQVPHAVVISF